MKRYERYKPSRIEWIGEIPWYWEEKRLKYSDYVIMGQSPSSVDYNTNKNGLPFLQGNAEFGTIFPTPKIWCETSSKIAQKNDILLSVRAPIGAVNISDQQYGIGRGLCAVRGVRACYKFLYYHLKARKDELNSIGTGSTYTAITVDEVNNLLIPYPSSDEQSTIADYLENKTAQLDDLIAKKQRLIDLLNEEKTAIINQTVTKGLNPDAPMRDSDIPWLGEIPEHWDFKKLKYVAVIKPSNVDKKSYDGEKKVLLCNYLDVYKNEFIDNSFSFMEATANENEITKFTIKKGDVLVTKDSETPDDIASPAYIKEDLENVICGYHLAQIRGNNIELIGEYLFRLFQSRKLNSHFEISANGITRFGLSVDSFQQVFVPLPPIKEQSDITRYIQTGNQRIDVTISKIEREISLLHEYRTALISDAVTGKIDVRGMA